MHRSACSNVCLHTETGKAFENMPGQWNITKVHIVFSDNALDKAQAMEECRVSSLCCMLQKFTARHKQHCAEPKTCALIRGEMKF